MTTAIICSERGLAEMKELRDTHLSLSHSLIALLSHSALINYYPSHNTSRFDFVCMRPEQAAN